MGATPPPVKSQTAARGYARHNLCLRHARRTLNVIPYCFLVRGLIPECPWRTREMDHECESERQTTVTQSLINPTIHDLLLQLSFTWADAEEVYGTSTKIEETGVSQPIFLLPRNGKFLILCWIGERQELEPAFLEGARTDNDGYSVEIFYQNSALCDASTSIAEAEEDLKGFIDRVFALAKYTAHLDEQINRNITRFNELLNEWDPYFKNSETLTHPEAAYVIPLLKESLDLRPSRDMWNWMSGSAAGFEQYQWAIGVEEKLGNQPWSPVYSFLREYGEARGWKLS